MQMQFDFTKFQQTANAGNRYQRHIDALASVSKDTTSITHTVNEALNRVSNEQQRAFVIYGEPQSGKTEMMIALTAKLLDEGRKTIVLLLNDSVQLLNQNLSRFRRSGLDPAPKSFAEILDPAVDVKDVQLVVFCKKNAKDLQKLIDKLGTSSGKVVIDDEADYATPNAKINVGQQTRINELIGKLLGADGQYIGVTATPARLDLNRTFENEQDAWVNFPTHPLYMGKDFFFPTSSSAMKNLGYRLNLLPDTHDLSLHLRQALFGYLVSVAKLNTEPSAMERNYSMLIHTSGARVDHSVDYKQVVEVFNVLHRANHTKREQFVRELWQVAHERFEDRADVLTRYVLENVNRHVVIVMNSDFDKRNQDYETATDPSTLFTIAIGGNIVSRGVTFNSLLAMFFTRDTKHKIQQDTYIQRARMFGTRDYPLELFELSIPESLYFDWHRCFVFHTLALNSIRSTNSAPVWLGDHRINAVSAASVDKARLDMNSGLMWFEKFTNTDTINELISSGSSSFERIDRLQALIGGKCLPKYVIDFIKAFSPHGVNSLAIHPSSSIEGYSDADPDDISRKKGLIGKSDREEAQYPNAVHHIKIYINDKSLARVFYRYEGRISFAQMIK
jgi:Z1 domain/Type III restriction enzyme, res subunit